MKFKVGDKVVATEDNTYGRTNKDAGIMTVEEPLLIYGGLHGTIDIAVRTSDGEVYAVCSKFFKLYIPEWLQKNELYKALNGECDEI